MDLGGTNLKWAVVAGKAEAGRVVARGSLPTEIATDPAAVPAGVIEQMVALGRAVVARHGPVTSVGVGVPGRYDPATGETRFLVNVPGTWAGRPVAAPVGAALGVPCALINDARAFGLAELRLGAGRGASSMVGLTLGTGVGGVIAIGGTVLLGHDGAAGEIGHQTIDPDGPACGCGSRGCLEAFTRADRLAEACGTDSAEEAVLAARSGDERARVGLERVGRSLGIGIANLVTLFTPDVVVLGGGMAAAGDLLISPIRAEMAQRVRMTDPGAVAISTAELGTWAGAIGAALYGAEAAGP